MDMNDLNRGHTFCVLSVAQELRLKLVFSIMPKFTDSVDAASYTK